MAFAATAMRFDNTRPAAHTPEGGACRLGRCLRRGGTPWITEEGEVTGCRASSSNGPTAGVIGLASQADDHPT
jgi:hypothetical protein